MPVTGINPRGVFNCLVRYCFMFSVSSGLQLNAEFGMNNSTKCYETNIARQLDSLQH